MFLKNDIKVKKKLWTFPRPISKTSSKLRDELERKTGL
jgi:hypothetical protein